MIQGEHMYSSNQTSQVFIDNQVTEKNDGLHIVWDYVEDLFDEDMISTMFDSYVHSLKALATNTLNAYSPHTIENEGHVSLSVEAINHRNYMSYLFNHKTCTKE